MNVANIEQYFTYIEYCRTKSNINPLQKYL